MINSIERSDILVFKATFAMSDILFVFLLVALR